MCWLCKFRETNPTVEQERMARELFYQTEALMHAVDSESGMTEEQANAAYMALLPQFMSDTPATLVYAAPVVAEDVVVQELFNAIDKPLDGKVH